MKKPFLFPTYPLKSNFSGFLYTLLQRQMKFHVGGLPYAALKLLLAYGRTLVYRIVHVFKDN